MQEHLMQIEAQLNFSVPEEMPPDLLTLFGRAP
jgi:hypothetical protein